MGVGDGSGLNSLKAFNVLIGGIGESCGSESLKGLMHSMIWYLPLPLPNKLHLHGYQPGDFPLASISDACTSSRYARCTKIASRPAPIYYAHLAAFHAHATAVFGLTEKNKWVSWGGSYPGMLAGWFRVTYPNLVHAAVASSAPVIAKLDMQEYNDVTAEAYALPSVGGSDACRANIADGHSTIGAMLNTSSGRDALAKTFRLTSGRWLESRAFSRR